MWLAIIYADKRSSCLKATIIEYIKPLLGSITTLASTAQSLNGFAQRVNQTVGNVVVAKNGGYNIENTKLKIE